MESHPQIQHGVAPSDSKLENEVMPFTKFLFSDLEKATQSFSVVKIVAEEACNVVYKGHLQNVGSVAIKTFKTRAWPDPEKFEEEAKRVGELKHKSLVSLIGCCADGDERLLVAEFLPNDTLAMRLFNDNNNTLEWSMRLKVACGIAEALDYCSTKGFTSFSNLSANSILFDHGDNACLSCFGLMKESEDGQATSSVDQFKSVAYKFGCVLLNLLTGKQYPDHAAMIHGQRDVPEFLDPKLEGNFPIEEAILMLGLAAQCMEQDCKHIPTSELIQMEKQHKEAAPSGQENPPSPLPTTSQCQGPPKKPASKTAGSRRAGPRRRHKTTTTQNDKEREAEKKSTSEKWRDKQAEKNAKREEKPKAKQTKPVQARNSNRNNNKTSSRF